MTEEEYESWCRRESRLVALRAADTIRHVWPNEDVERFVEANYKVTLAMYRRCRLHLS